MWTFWAWSNAFWVYCGVLLITRRLFLAFFFVRWIIISQRIYTKKHFADRTFFMDHKQVRYEPWNLKKFFTDVKINCIKLSMTLFLNWNEKFLKEMLKEMYYLFLEICIMPTRIFKCSIKKSAIKISKEKSCKQPYRLTYWG